MSGLLRLLGLSAVTAGLSAFVCVAEAVQATGRSAYNNVRTTPGVATGTASVRMPSMPTLPIISVGNITQDSTDVPAPTPTPSPSPSPSPSPIPPIEPMPDKPVSDCPDGKPRNSDYTIDMCMNDIANCVNNGALPNGLNDMFNEDVRNSIVNGMRLCSVQVDKCISDVRRDCANVYRSAADVWIDFNSRRVQPEYYNFVLRKTGLTPNQAENTCLLLDRNTYGNSFTAVNANGTTSSEYNKQVGAYNSQENNTLTKDNPLGVAVNTNGAVDAQRGHYARWDATTATCYIRVAAYNKDKQITNSWLFGGAGDDRLAEVWKPAGESFNCNKDLFGFSLMKDTATAAVVGIGGGAVLGVGIGAAAGHGDRNFDCSDDKNREKLFEVLKKSGNIGVLNAYLDNQLSTVGSGISEAQCQEVAKLYDVYAKYESAVSECEEAGVNIRTTFEAKLECSGFSNMDDCFVAAGEPFTQCKDQGYTTAQQCVDFLANQFNAGKLTGAEKIVSGNCSFNMLNKEKARTNSIYCTAQSGCVPYTSVRVDLNRLAPIMSGLDLLQGEKSNYGKSIGIGAAAGVGAGGIATAITALVEQGNINCRVGDGLAQVGLNKTYTIGNLKDFYVKWNLRLPDVIGPTALITDCQSWKNTCATFYDKNQCNAAQFNYKPAGAPTVTLVPTACQMSGSVCVENYSVAKSHGACE